MHPDFYLCYFKTCSICMMCLFWMSPSMLIWMRELSDIPLPTSFRGCGLYYSRATLGETFSTCLDFSTKPTIFLFTGNKPGIPQAQTSKLWEKHRQWLQHLPNLHKAVLVTVRAVLNLTVKTCSRGARRSTQSEPQQSCSFFKTGISTEIRGNLFIAWSETTKYTPSSSTYLMLKRQPSS